MPPGFCFWENTCRSLLDLFVHRMALEMWVVLLLFDALGDGLLVAERQVTGNGLTLFLRFGAFQGDEFLHGDKWIEGSDKRTAGARRNLNLPAPQRAQRRFSVSGNITPRRKRVTCPVLDDTTMEMQWAATLIAAAAACRLPSPLGRE